MNFLKCFDFYESFITLSFKKDDLYRTPFGGLLTLITSIILLIITLIFFIQLINRENYTILASTSIDHSSCLDFSNIPIMVGLIEATNLISLDDRLFNIELLDIQYESINNKGDNAFSKLKTTKLKLINCSYLEKNESYFRSNVFSNFNLSKYLCISPGQNISFYGSYSDLTNGFKGIIFNVNKCNNETLKQNKKNFSCYPEEIINRRLESAKFVYHYVGYNLNTRAKRNKDIYTQKISGSIMLSLEIKKGIYITFSKINYYIDDGLFMRNSKKTELFMSSGSSTDDGISSYRYQGNKIIDNNTIGFISFNMDDKVLEYNKSYEKFMTFIINLGGIFNVVILIGKLINKFISRKIKLLDIIETLVKRSQNVEKEFRCKSSCINLQKIKKYRISNINDEQNLIIKNISLKSVQYINKRFNPLDESNGSFENKSDELFNINKNNINNNSKVQNYKKKDKSSILSIYKSNYNFEDLSHVKEIKNHIFYYYLCPTFLLKFHKNNHFNSLFNTLSSYLSVETLFDIYCLMKHYHVSKVKEPKSSVEDNRLISKNNYYSVRNLKKNRNEND